MDAAVDAGHDAARSEDAGADARGPTPCTEAHELRQLRAASDADASAGVQPAITASDVPSGLVRCSASGGVHRARAEVCRYALPFDPAVHCDGFDPEYPEVCRPEEDAGVCGDPPCLVWLGCASDDECVAGELCVCATEGLQGLSRCVPAECRTDADCGEHQCGAVPHGCGFDVIGFRCRTPGDECAGDEDCGGNDQCTFDDSAARWLCQSRWDCE